MASLLLFWQMYRLHESLNVVFKFLRKNFKQFDLRQLFFLQLPAQAIEGKGVYINFLRNVFFITYPTKGISCQRGLPGAKREHCIRESESCRT